MLRYDDAVKRYGKTRTEAMIKAMPKNGKTGAEKDRGIKGRIKCSYCADCHAWIVENYEFKGHAPGFRCTERRTKDKDFKPTFNVGLGAFVESRSEERKLAKSLGLEET